VVTYISKNPLAYGYFLRAPITIERLRTAWHSPIGSPVGASATVL
jgi:hypothetical protein